ncbi:GntR family transcriptional regulator [Halalkalibacter hemicellulosilyticus]|uniref:Transcriptional regulator n=1 Tax=Halalkalibacter hemicellulosilyticusJCM 9152 TaxID=1236971 RepID=W4QNC3_9BACI|nr:GntR family transcriptional regulator [Halalkalibacter hemicellulosilyticus]GAE32844.1 transcriptional regulator [Halalkalibacter hemicellulosilyticusJCM 9152]
MTQSKQREALYLLVKDKIVSLIQEKDLNQGDKLPTEASFCQLFNVSRTTVRIALQQLELEGKVYREQGRGTFVSKPKVQTLLTTTKKGFSEQMKDQGLLPKRQVLGLDVIPINSYVSKQLHIEEGKPVYKLVRIRYANSDPIQYETSYIPWEQAPGLTTSDCTGSLYELLKDKFQISIHHTIEAIEPILADEQISKLLQTKMGSPCLAVETIACTNNKQPFEYSYVIFRGDRSRFIIERNYE